MDDTIEPLDETTDVAIDSFPIGTRITFPLVRMPLGRKLNLENFDFDDLLA